MTEGEDRFRHRDDPKPDETGEHAAPPPATPSPEATAEPSPSRRQPSPNRHGGIRRHPLITLEVVAVAGLAAAAGLGAAQNANLNDKFAKAQKVQSNNIVTNQIGHKQEQCTVQSAIVPPNTAIFAEPHKLSGSAWYGLSNRNNRRDWGDGAYYVRSPQYFKLDGIEWLSFRKVTSAEKATYLNTTPVNPAAEQVVSASAAAEQVGYVDMNDAHTDIANLPPANQTGPNTISFRPWTGKVAFESCFWGKDGTPESDNHKVAYGWHVDPNQIDAILTGTPVAGSVK